MKNAQGTGKKKIHFGSDMLERLGGSAEFCDQGRVMGTAQTLRDSAELGDSTESRGQGSVLGQCRILGTGQILGDRAKSWGQGIFLGTVQSLANSIEFWG